MNFKQIEAKLLEIIHQITGWGDSLRPHCEIEDLTINDINEDSNANQIVNFKYIFDEDGWSQYDKTHVLKGTTIINSKGNIIKIDMEEIHTGVATIRLPYNSLKKDKK